MILPRVGLTQLRVVLGRPYLMCVRTCARVCGRARSVLHRFQLCVSFFIATKLNVNMYCTFTLTCVRIYFKNR